MLDNIPGEVNLAAPPQGEASHRTEFMLKPPPDRSFSAGPADNGNCPLLAQQGAVLYSQLGYSPTNAGLAPSVAEKRER